MATLFHFPSSPPLNLPKPSTGFQLNLRWPRHRSRWSCVVRSYKVVVQHEGRSTELEVEPDETILAKALDSGLSVPHDCKLGVCMTCPAKLLAGTVDQSEDKLQFRCVSVLPSQEASSSRRHAVACAGASIVMILTINYGLAPSPVHAEDKSNGEEENDGVLGAIKSLLGPNAKTKSGRVLPKAYLKSAKEVVKTLRESLKEDPKDNAKFRRSADAAKESIREYLSNWRGQQSVAQEESYVELEKAIRSLANFYSKAGPSAPLPEEVKFEILNDLNTAEEFL